MHKKDGEEKSGQKPDQVSFWPKLFTQSKSDLLYGMTDPFRYQKKIRISGNRNQITNNAKHQRWK